MRKPPSQPSPSHSPAEPHAPETVFAHQRPNQICDEPPALFSLGNVVATPAALALIKKHGASIPQLLSQHQTGTGWQKLSQEDCDANWRAAFNGERVLSVFNLVSTSGTSSPVNPNHSTDPAHTNKIWIITEWDRSYTTVLTPGCY